MVMDTTLSDPLVGRLLEGRYAVEAFIAHGGMASVYLATDTRLERRVAVKVLHAHLSDDRETVARFEREARAAARLSHPDVVAVYDQGTDNGRPFLVMEFVPGANLRQVRARPRPALDRRGARGHGPRPRGARRGARGRSGPPRRQAGERPRHRRRPGEGRRLRAGPRGRRQHVTTTGSVLMGTAAYLAPEQFEHGTADERSDVYSAGVLFFELLTGTTPFEADSTYALLQPPRQRGHPRAEHASRGHPAAGRRARHLGDLARPAGAARRRRRAPRVAG